ncbi:hypothetical protein NMG60_11014289 [Bertholletia excelsa]
MVLFLLNFLFAAVSSVWNVLTWAIFTATAHFIVIVIQSFKTSGEFLLGGLEQVGELIKGLVEYIFGVLIDTISTVVSTVFQSLVEGVSGMAAGVAEAAGVLTGIAQGSAEGVLGPVLEVVSGFVEMITTMVSDLWSNYQEAVGYVQENS